MILWNLLWVMAGGAAGAVLRYSFGRLFVSGGFPAATLGVNVIGSFLIGIACVWLQNRMGDDALRLFIMTGLLGGFTTFSAFSLETLTLLQSGSGGKAALNILLSVGVCLAACLAGMRAGAGL